MAKIEIPIIVNMTVDEVIERLKADGYVQVVRCRKCKRFDGQELCERHGFFVGLNADTFFCADGKRKEIIK